MDAGAGLVMVGIVTTLGIAIVGWKQAARARADAREANNIARHSLALARSAEDRANRLEAVAQERRDVEWECTLMADPGAVDFCNIGTDPAYEVEVHFLWEGGINWESSRLPEVLPLECIGVEIAWPSTPKPATVRLSWKSLHGVPETRVWPGVHVGGEGGLLIRPH